ncbi:MULTISPECIES: hypothetical protein [Kitasatospora]|nr:MULTISPECIES: hypothetical protein [Kitasatospora]
MGKRQRRRNREGVRQAAAPARVLYPTADQPLVEVHVAPGTAADLREVCELYWEFDEPGTWARNVSAIGTNASRIVKEAAVASLLTVMCPGCQSPLTVTTRSEMAATGYWGRDTFPLTPVQGRQRCLDCVEAAKIARAREVEHARAAEKERDERRVKSASEWLTQQAEVKEADDNPGVRSTLVLLAAVNMMHRTEKESFGPLRTAKYTFTGTLDRDIEAIKELHSKRWLVPTFPATVGDIVFDDDDRAVAVYVTQIPWRLPAWMGIGADARDMARGSADYILEYETALGDLREEVLNLEADLVVRYLSGLLAHKYQEAPIPEDRLTEAHDTARDALESGFSVGQMVAVAWSAASRSVAWGARTPWIKPGMVSAAAVTNLGKGVGYAKDRPVVEYELPHWLAEPAILAIGRRILRGSEGRQAVHDALRSVQQRINAREPVDLHDALVEPADDLVVAPADSGGPTDMIDFIAAPESDIDRSPLITCALVEADGSMEFKTITVDQMKELAGDPYGVDRIFVDGTPSINAYCTEYADNAIHGFNYVAGEMLRLLGGGVGAARGSIAFFQVRKGSHIPSSLDLEHQELLKLAHRAVTGTGAESP